MDRLDIKPRGRMGHLLTQDDLMAWVHRSLRGDVTAIRVLRCVLDDLAQHHMPCHECGHVFASDEPYAFLVLSNVLDTIFRNVMAFCEPCFKRGDRLELIENTFCKVFPDAVVMFEPRHEPEVAAAAGRRGLARKP